MTDLSFKVNLAALTASPTFAEASAEELRVLFALLSPTGAHGSAEQLATLAAVSRARVLGALALWEEAGVIERETAGVSFEFEERPGDKFNPREAKSAELARDIRDNSLAGLITECTRIMKKGSLTHSEIAAISALYTQLALSPEYILTLAAHLAERGRLTPRRLASKAESLVAKDIDTLEALEIYVAESERSNAAVWEFRRVLGIWGRATAPSEREAFLRWSDEYGYGPEIVRTAYDLSVRSISKLSVAHIDAIIRTWHEGGCKTVAECKRAAEQFSADLAAKEKERSKRGGKKQTAKEEPKYSDFNSEDALMQALLRSYGDGDDKKEDNG